MNIADLLKDSNKAKEILDDALGDKNKELAEILIPIAKDPYLTYSYAYLINKLIKDEWEDIIAQDSGSSCSYAIDILHKPFIKGENAIARDPGYSYYYAIEVLKDRFIKGEKTIIKSKWLNEYVRFLKNKNKLNEFLKDHPEVKL